MEMTYLMGFIVVFIVSFLLTPGIAKVARNLNIIAVPGARHIHKKATPRMGGLAIYTAFMIGCAIFVKGDQQIMAVLIGGFIIALSGVLDDLTELSALVKIIFQLAATFVVVFYGEISIDYINIPGGLTLNFGFLSKFVTVVWIIGITNAVNLIDGLDGLCAGVSSIILATFAMISYMQVREDIVLISILLLAATIGFLFHNFYPASVFMGDTGSLFIGYMIATISLMGFKSSAFLTLGPAIFILAIPILDTFLSIVRRKLKGVAISSADKEHLHHTLMFKLNLSQVKTVLIIYAVTFYFSQVAYVYLLDKKVALIMLIIAAIAIDLFVEKTRMISKKYRPILGTFDRIKKQLKRGKNNE